MCSRFLLNIELESVFMLNDLGSRHLLSTNPGSQRFLSDLILTCSHGFSGFNGFVFLS